MRIITILSKFTQTLFDSGNVQMIYNFNSYLLAKSSVSYIMMIREKHATNTEYKYSHQHNSENKDLTHVDF